MTRIGVATVQIQPSFKGFQESAKKSILAELGPLSKEIGEPAGDKTGEEILASTGKRFKTGALKVAKVGGGLLTAGLITTVTKGFTRSKAIEDAEAKLEGLGKSSEEISAIMDNALKSVQGTAYGLDEASTTAGILVAAGIQSGEELEKTLKLVGDSATIAGRDMGDMGLIWASVASQGKLQGQDAMQLMQSGIPIWQMVGDVMGVTAAEAQELGSKGQVSFDIFRQAMEGGVGGAALAAGETTGGAFRNMQAAMSRFGQKLISSIYPKIAPLLTKLGEKFDEWGEKAGPVADMLIERLTNLWNNVLKPVASWVRENAQTIAIITGAVAGFITAAAGLIKVTKFVSDVKKAVSALSVVLKALVTSNPVLLIITAIVTALVLLWTKCEWFRDAVKTVWEVISSAVKTAWEQWIQPAFEAIRTFIMDTLVPALQGFWENTVRPIWEKISAAVKTAWEQRIQPAFEAIWGFITNTLGPIFTWLYDTIIKQVWDKITQVIRNAWDVIRIIWDTIKWTVNNVLGPVFTWLWETIIRPAWEGISGAISWAWENVIRPAFDAVKDAVGLVGQAFETVKDVVVGAWEAMVNLLVKPINFVIDTVYNNGIRKAFNWVAQAVGSSIRLEEASTINPFGTQSRSNTKPSTSGRRAAGPLNWEARAKGGWTPPGWTLVGEEGPELVNFSRPSRVYTAEETAAALAGADISPYLRPDRMYTPDEAWSAIHALKTGDQRLLQGALGSSPSQSLLPIGGFWDSLGHAWSKTWRGVKDFVADGISWVRGRLADAAGLVLNPIKEKIASMVEGHGTISDMVGDAFRRTIDNLLEWVRGIDNESNESGETSEAKNNAAAMNEAALSGAEDLKDLQRNAVVLGGATRRPVKGGVLTSTFGVSRYGGYHAGIDLAAPTGTPVYAYRSGTVLGTGWNVLAGRSGIGVMLSHGQYGGSYYGHLSASKVHRGQAVTAGQLIGLVGATGNATGPHLHWELNKGNWQAPYNPLPLLPRYDQGGWLMPGMATVANLTGSPEPVLTQAQWDAISTLAARGAGATLPDRVTLVDADGSILARARVVAGEVVERAADEAARWE
ncbi:peptidoglycan DD-metalloendopeptidase family protein [Actinobaculum sp. 352]|uniref:peptidoglycan DD-metalloendopeptidase family protein n=1 Tax=Actinobaculum sp. 352 TaxID=2490946 RepID=UPI000F7EE418|nr:peptidoglycan DD-metalloendopeptidase family protein [Actinobaculum sp. 352]RTE48830.1 hypothetical protein EKN07_08995 [Actinobaculum sp. 352]